MEYNWKTSPSTGNRVWSSREIGSEFGISSQLLNKTLEKYGILIKAEDNQWRIKDTSLGENCYFNTAHRYDNAEGEHTTNVTVKFNEIGKNLIENLLVTRGLYKKVEFDTEFDELTFPEGKCALSIRRANTFYNNTNTDMIYISYRTNRNNTRFSRNYMFISNSDCKRISKLIEKYGKEYKFKTNGYRAPLDSSSSYIVEIILWKDKYFTEILTKNGYITKLSKEQIKSNVSILKEYLND